MSTAPSVVSIWNRALQLLGSQRVQSTSDTTKNAIACNACYEQTRDAMYEEHPFRFTLKQATLAADSPAPTWGRANSFTLPSDFIGLFPDYEEDNALTKDWDVENGRVFTDDGAPLYVRYVSQVEDPAKMTPTFREALAHRMALAMCEELTQSNTKKATLITESDRVFKLAKRANARNVRAQEPPESSWITSRRS